jgi:hypothetical protein
MEDKERMPKLDVETEIILKCPKGIGLADENYIRLAQEWDLWWVKSSGSDGVECEDGCLLECCAVFSGRSLPKCQRSLLPVLSKANRPKDGGSKHL